MLKFFEYRNFLIISRDESSSPLILTTPASKPSQYNSTLNPVSVDFTLDPSCRYRISAKNSFAQSASRIVQQFSHWIPAHLVAILLLAFRHQIAITPQKEVFKCGSLTKAYLAGTTFFILTGNYFGKIYAINNLSDSGTHLF